MSNILTNIFALIFVVCVVYAMISDYTRLRIPNWVSIALASAFLPYALLVGLPGFWPHVALGAGAFLVLFAFFAMGWLGAGDVKFLAAVMLWTGPEHSARFVLLFTILGGAFALSLLALRKVAEYAPGLNGAPVIGQCCRWARSHACPYGLPIGLAALWMAPAIFA